MEVREILCRSIIGTVPPFAVCIATAMTQVAQRGCVDGCARPSIRISHAHHVYASTLNVNHAAGACSSLSHDGHCRLKTTGVFPCEFVLKYL